MLIHIRINSTKFRLTNFIALFNKFLWHVIKLDRESIIILWTIWKENELKQGFYIKVVYDNWGAEFTCSFCKKGGP